ncbi:MAG: ATP-binding protein [Acidobacteriota bacterium]
MTSRLKTLAMQYGASILAFIAALLLTQLLWPLIKPSATPLFFAAVMVAAFYGGLGPGILVTVLSTLAIDFFFIPPIHALEFTVANLVRAGMFMLVAIMISWLNAARKRLTEELRKQDGEREKLLQKISGFNDELRRKVEMATHALSETNSALFETQQRLARSERLAVAGQMAASLAHEIGTPLNAISGHLKLLARDHPEHGETQRRVQIIGQQLDFIIQIVRNLLEWTHKKRAELQPTDINALVRELLWLVAPTLDQHAITTTVTLDQELSLIAAHRDGLRQVFLNLINNSVDAMPEGGKLEITTRLDWQRRVAELIFRDTGVGIEPGALEHVFEPLWTTKPSGSGFGLAIAHEIMDEHSGRIEVLEEPGQGAVFRLTLPLAQAEVASAG